MLPKDSHSSEKRWCSTLYMVAIVMHLISKISSLANYRFYSIVVQCHTSLPEVLCLSFWDMNCFLVVATTCSSMHSPWDVS
jgi:type IV secretory pathway VirB3-like protein